MGGEQAGIECPDWCFAIKKKKRQFRATLNGKITLSLKTVLMFMPLSTQKSTSKLYMSLRGSEIRGQMCSANTPLANVYCILDLC